MKKYKMKINDQSYEAHVVEFSKTNAKVIVNGVDFFVQFDNSESESTQPPQSVQPQPQPQAVVHKPAPSAPENKTVNVDLCEVKAPIPGVIVSILKTEGMTVEAGDVILTLEAMKMESEICAPFSGVIEKVVAKEKATVQEGDLLMKIAVKN